MQNILAPPPKSANTKFHCYYINRFFIYPWIQDHMNASLPHTYLYSAFNYSKKNSLCVLSAFVFLFQFILMWFLGYQQKLSFKYKACVLKWCKGGGGGKNGCATTAAPAAIQNVIFLLITFCSSQSKCTLRSVSSSHDKKCIHRFLFCFLFEMISICSFTNFILFIYSWILIANFLLWSRCILLHVPIGTIGKIMGNKFHSPSFFFSDFLGSFEKWKNLNTENVDILWLRYSSILVSIFQQKAT